MLINVELDIGGRLFFMKRMDKSHIDIYSMHLESRF